MSSIATLNGVQYIIPAYNDTGWAQGAGNLSLYLAAVAANTLQPTGGSFALTADVDFGASFGLKALYLKSETANIATAGVIRLANTDQINWRNAANSANVGLTVDSVNRLTYNGIVVASTSGLAILGTTNQITASLAGGGVTLSTPQDIAAVSTPTFAGLTLTAFSGVVKASAGVLSASTLVNADVSSSAAIAYSKLALSGSIVNADVNTSAAIAVSKLAALTISRALVSDGSGFVSAATTTSTEIGYVNGVTSAIQTQMDTKYAKAGGQLTGNLSFDSASHGVVGITSGSQAASGNVGQIVTSSAALGNATTSGNYGDITSITVAAGNYILFCSADFRLGAGGTMTNASVGVSTTTGNSSAGLTFGTNQFGSSVPTSGTDSSASFAFAVTVSGSTTYYLKYQTAWTTTAAQVGGTLTVLRIS